MIIKRFGSFDEGVAALNVAGFDVISNRWVYPTVMPDDYPTGGVGQNLNIAALFDDGTLQISNQQAKGLGEYHKKLRESFC